MAGSSSNSGCLIWIIIIIAAIAIPTVFGNSGNGGSDARSTNGTAQTSQQRASTQGGTNSNVDPDANLTPQTPPQNGDILDGSNGGDSGVKVSTSPGSSAYVKVKDGSGRTVVGFFVQPSASAEVYVPEGTYSVQFAMGETWYGKKNLFGSRTSLGQDKEVSLGYGDMITYSLQYTPSGNFSMQSLDASQF